MMPALERVSTFGRVLHLFTAASFLYCGVSGMGIAFPKLHWMLILLGGGEFARWLHPWAGVVFSASGALTFLHPHAHGLVAEQYWGGMVSAIQVADEVTTLAAYGTPKVMILKDISLLVTLAHD